ncbi:hypothetical protein D3C73_1578580 [compost metagenome]
MQCLAGFDLPERDILRVQEGICPRFAEEAEGSVSLVIQMDKGQRGTRLICKRNSRNINTAVKQCIMQQ